MPLALDIGLQIDAVPIPSADPRTYPMIVPPEAGAATLGEVASP